MRFSSVFVAAAVSAAATLQPVLADAPLAPSTITAAPATYDGKTVTVAGNVAQFQTASSPRGALSVYQLCDSACVVVLDFSKPAYKNGDKQTASGKFYTTFKGPKRTFNNVVMVK